MPAPAEVGVSGPAAAVSAARTLIGALNLVTRGLPLPPDVLRAVSGIYLGDAGDGPSSVLGEVAGEDGDQGVPSPDEETNGRENGGMLLKEFEDAIFMNRQNEKSYTELERLKEDRMKSSVERRLMELEELPSSRGEDLQMKCLLELYGLKLFELQKKVRSDITAEYRLLQKCSHPHKQLYDWGMMRIQYPYNMYGVGDSFMMEMDDRHRKKRYTERMSRLEEEEKNLSEMRKKKFFAEILDATREFLQQAQFSTRRKKNRNEGVLAWHGRARQRILRSEKLRFQLLKEENEEEYARMVEESKNERLKMLLGKTNEVLFGLGAAVQRQKDAEHVDETSNGSDSDDHSQSETPVDSFLEDEAGAVNDLEQNTKQSDYLEGQRQYHLSVHAIEEKVTEQPSILRGGVLRPYQLEGLQWMLSLFNNNSNGILADEMGLGKTIQTIALIAYLLEKKGVTGPHIIVAPKAVLPNWSNEFSVWAPSIATVLYDGRPEERKLLREEYFKEDKFSVLLTHYDLIMKDKKFLKKVYWHYMIVDEGHRLKNHDCALARTIVTGFRIRRRLLLTGTPIQNSLQELWALLNFLLPTIFNSIDNFEEWFNAPFATDVNLTDEEQLLIIRRLHQVIRPFLLRRKKDEVEKYLPSKKQVILKCDISAWQKAYYKQITDKGRVGNLSGIKSQSLQNLTMQLRKCCNHPYLFVQDYNMRQKEQIVRASGKFELLDRLLPKLRKAGHRVLLFSQMTRLMDILELYLQLYAFEYLRLDGSTKTEERGRLVELFNAPNSPYFMFLLSTRAGGLGLNLQSADTVIIFDSDWNPQMDRQAEARAHRIGQKNEVRVFVLVSVGSIEEEILERAKQKMGIDAKVIQAGLFNTTSTAQDRREMLQEIMRRGTSSLGTDVPSEREINRLAARTDDEFRLFEKMDEERRARESYRSRLMEEYEVPEWVYRMPDTKPGGQKGFDASEVSGKRRRKEVIYDDALTDYQWMKAVEEGEDLSKLTAGSKGTAYLSDPQQSDVSAERNDYTSLGDEINDNTSDQTPETLREGASSKDESEGEGTSGADASSLQGKIITWESHKRKRSSYGNSTPTSSENERRVKFKQHFLP